MDKIDKIRESKRKYGKFYNKINVNVQLDRKLISELRETLSDEVSVKSYIENLIKRTIQ